MDVVIGSNVFRNTDGTVEVQGVPQIEIELRNPEGPLFVNFVLFDEKGRLIAKIVKSSMSFNELGVYDLSRTPTSLTVTHRQSGKVVLQVDLKEPGRVVIPRGEFITARGHQMEITPAEWRIGKSRSSNADNDLQGEVVAIG